MRLLRENRVPSEPRFSFVTEKAYDFLLEYGYDHFPISPFQVLDDLSEFVTCLPWSDAKKILKSPDPFHLRALEAEARTIRPRSNGKYYIVYDDVNVNSEARIAWTIMHEIGHIVLGHLTDFGETSLDRGGLTKAKYGVLEIEAHYFAAEFLMPTALLKFFPDITVNEIILLFGVSEPAAKKKYKRVFKVGYMPDSKYDEKLIRNFYEFLETNIDATVYKNIYGPWGMARKAEYIPICRKCPSCYTYVTDQSAIYCPYCGSLIEQRQTYSRMFDRLRDQQQFAKIPGFSHPNLPYKETVKESGLKERRVTVCPTCLNNAFSTDARYCSICGQPLFSFCDECNSPLDLGECFCPNCGKESEFGVHYKQAETRLRQIKDCSRCPEFSEEWLQYPYWGYVRMRLMGNGSPVPDDMKSALMYSNAYLDDMNNVIVFADTLLAAATIYDNREIVLSFMRKSDGVEYGDMEVFVANVL